MRRLMPSSAVLALCLAAAPGAGLASNPQRAMQDAPPPASRIAAANAAARVQPLGENYLNATQVYALSLIHISEPTRPY